MATPDASEQTLAITEATCERGMLNRARAIVHRILLLFDSGQRVKESKHCAQRCPRVNTRIIEEH
eukprot:3788587-Alexandrium_andersonii.AAC.1